MAHAESDVKEIKWLKTQREGGLSCRTEQPGEPCSPSTHPITCPHRPETKAGGTNVLISPTDPRPEAGAEQTAVGGEVLGLGSGSEREAGSCC